MSKIVGNNPDGNTMAVSGTLTNPLANYAPCVATNGVDQGICLTSPVCSFYGGQPGGNTNCRSVSTCCVSK